MFYAYVHYPADKEKAIMPVCLIKDYNPKTETDIPSEPVQAYWRSEAGLEEGYYEAKVVLLASKYLAFAVPLCLPCADLFPQRKCVRFV